MKGILKFIPLIILSTACSTDPVINMQARFIDTGISRGEWVSIPKGKYYHGMHSHDSIIDYDYKIMKTQVTNQQYLDFLEAALAEEYIKIEDGAVKGYYPGERFDAYNHEVEITEGDKILIPLDEPGGHIHFGDGNFYLDKGFENHPVVMVSWFGAWAYSEYYGFRLPRESEWEKAARGPDKRAYPWGDEIEPDIANYNHRKHKLDNIMEVTAARTTPVGFYNGNSYNGMQTRENKNFYGLYDMAGNVWEWTADDYPDLHYRFMRGGSFTNYSYNLTVWARNNAGPDHYSFNIGFRCVR